MASVVGRGNLAPRRLRRNAVRRGLRVILLRRIRVFRLADARDVFGYVVRLRRNAVRRGLRVILLRRICVFRLAGARDGFGYCRNSVRCGLDQFHGACKHFAPRERGEPGRGGVGVAPSGGRPQRLRHNLPERVNPQLAFRVGERPTRQRVDARERRQPPQQHGEHLHAQDDPTPAAKRKAKR